MNIHNILASPFLMVLWMCDVYLLLICLRIIAQRPSLCSTTFSRTLRELTDPLYHRVSRRLAATHPRIASQRITWLTTVAALLLLRYAVLCLVVTVF